MGTPVGLYTNQVCSEGRSITRFGKETRKFSTETVSTSGAETRKFLPNISHHDVGCARQPLFSMGERFQLPAYLFARHESKLSKKSWNLRSWDSGLRNGLFNIKYITIHFQTIVSFQKYHNIALENGRLSNNINTIFLPSMWKLCIVFFSDFFYALKIQKSGKK